MQTSLELLSRVRSGDSAALEELLVRCSPGIGSRIAAEIPPRWQSLLSSDDVMQQTWLDAFLRIETLAAEEEAGFVAWLAQMARNNFLDALRQLEAAKRGGNAQRMVAGTGPSQTLAAAVFGMDSQTPSRVAISTETEQMLHSALECLPATYQTVVQRYDLEGCSIDEVAAALGRSPGSVYMLRSRAHELLRQLLSSARDNSRQPRE